MHQPVADHIDHAPARFLQARIDAENSHADNLSITASLTSKFE
jgi:hypothetical protein